MGVAALYDIHGNIDALNAVLEEVEREGADQIVIGGDIGWGPFPAQVLNQIAQLGDRVHVIRGNADREVAEQPGEHDPESDWVVNVTLWCSELLNAQQQRWLAKLPLSTTLEIDGLGDVLFCHATPRSDEEIITAITPDDELEAVVAATEEHTIVCGHTHSQFDRAVGGTRFINAGSVGLPYEDAPGAYWAMLGPEVAFRHTEYDGAAAAARIMDTGCPAAEWFAEAIAAPSARAQAIETFEMRRSTSSM